MNYIETEINGVWILEPKLFRDDRGYFMETGRQEDFDKNIGYPVHFIQDNQSKSSYGVLRGLHYQKGSLSQAKLVRVISGKVLDVAVDLRRDSKTFGKYVAVELSEENNRQLFIPRGFAHGFQVLSPSATFAYKVDSILYNDDVLNIQWPITNSDHLILSEKDLQHAVSFNEAEKF